MWSVERRGAIAIATYTAPPMNYYVDAAFGQLDGLADEWAVDETLAAIVLTGGVEGKFITHFDVEGILATQEAPDTIAQGPKRSRIAQAVSRRLNDLPQVVIAAMNGDTMGWGFELSLACDLRIAQRGDFRIGLPEVRLGVTPAGSGITRLTKLVGRGKALDLILRAQVIPPEDAFAAGMVTELADDALARALEIAEEIAGLPWLAVAMAKRSIYQGADMPVDIALAMDLESSFRLKQSPEIQIPMREYLSLPLEDRRKWLDPRRESS